MTTPSHLLAGFTILTLTQKWWGAGLTDTQTAWLLVIGVALSVLIDLDSLWSSNFLQNHHQQFTHWPLTWLIISLTVAGIGLLTPFTYLVNVSLVILLVAYTHLTLDLFAVTSGIPLLAPFTRHEFALTRLHEPFTNNVDRTRHVLTHPWIIYREVLLIGAGLLFILSHPKSLPFLK